VRALEQSRKSTSSRFPISFSCFKSFIYFPLEAISSLARFIYEILLFACNGRRPSPSRVANRRGCKLSNTISRFTRRKKFQPKLKNKINVNVRSFVRSAAPSVERALFVVLELCVSVFFSP